MVNPEDFARLKQQIYVMRNGVMADSLRAAGCPYRLIFGLNIPQLAEIAAQHGPDPEMALELRRHADLRENVLIATMLYPADRLTLQQAREWVQEVRWAEDADILTFKLLRHVPFAAQLAGELCASADRLTRYTGLSLWIKVISQDPQGARDAAQTELTREDPLTVLARRIIDEADFIRQPD